MTETTTIRIPVETRERLIAHKDGDQSIGDIVTWLANAMPTNTELTRARDRIAAYLRTHLIRDFGDRDELSPGQQLWADLAALQYQAASNTTDGPAAVLLDHTALAMLATGRRLLAQLIYSQPDHHQRHIYAPTQAIYTATVQHAGLARHLERLQVIEPCGFDLDATLIVGEKVPSNVTPAVAHVVHAAQPSTRWPTGRPVVTTVPQIYQPYRLQTYALPDQP